MGILPLGYQVGALLYAPAIQLNVVDTLVNQKIPAPFSFAFCLEDTIQNDRVEEAELELEQVLTQLLRAHRDQSFYLPKLFIRVRSVAQLKKLAVRFAPVSSILTGFILPKFFTDNCGQYIQAMEEINAKADKPYYFMPIFESARMIDLTGRYEGLYAVKKQLERVSSAILNIRVGGNDLCHAFGLRRHSNQTIYEVQVIASLLTDIFAAFGTDYVVSGAVWEYYSGPDWEAGLARELSFDLLNGFVGKTAIHPKQVPIITRALQVSQADYEDARSILNWTPQQATLVAASAAKDRMNEYNTHCNWARRTLLLAEGFGVSKH